MPNPFFSNKTSPNGATAPNDSLNESYKKYFRGYNKFNLTRNFYNTERYADINLIDVLEGVEGDKLSIANQHEIRSFAMNAPTMFELYKKKSYFAVNNLAILPNNWKKIYKQPNKGDDVSVNVNCVSSFLSYFKSFFTSIGESTRFDTPTADNYNFLWRVLLLLESIFSNGSLLSSMNCHLSNTIRVNDGSSFDSWLEETFANFNFEGSNGHFLLVDFPTLNKSFITFGYPTNSDLVFAPNRTILDMMRTFSDFNMSFSANDPYESMYNYLLSRLDMISFRYDDDLTDEDEMINLSRLIAYQLVCTQFYTRDSVDNIYNAESFLDNAKSVILPVASTDLNSNPLKWPTFQYNGTNYEYDVFSGAIIDSAFSQFFNTNSIDYRNRAFAYLHMIFFFRKSLRYGDYFVGAKTLPYAPLDVTAEVVGSGVSALDMTRSIIAQRFANAVERVNNTWKDYLKGVTGGVASPNPFEPRFLASHTSNVSGFEVENTASIEEQGKIVTLLRSTNSKYVYEVEVGEPCIIIGVSTYEVPRVYSATVERFFRHTDRFNMFNKFFQNIGDQEITQNERNAAFSPLSTFGYQPRHMEYKQRYPIASGGFVDNLPGYAFITDNAQSLQNDIDLGDRNKISSYYLRNRNSEFDRFFNSRFGLTLASYFHFEVKYTNVCHALRQMEYSPSIL